MRDGSSYGKTNQPGADPVFCMLAELLALQCPLKPCGECRQLQLCLKWWDRLCNKSIREPLSTDELEAAKKRMLLMAFFK